MKAQEKRLTALLLVLLGLMFLVKGVPWLKAYYQEGKQDIARLELRIERYQKLIEDTELWQDREALQRAETDEYRKWIFASDDQVAIGVQRALQQVAEQSGVTRLRTPVAELSVIDDWMKVSQTISFTLEQHEVLPFLQALNAFRPKLYIEEFQISTNSRQYSGEITVVGFSPVTN